MKNKKLIALIILSILAVLSLVYGTTAPTKVERMVKLAEKMIQIKKVEGPGDKIPPTRAAKRTGHSQWRRSPFISPGDDVKGKGPLVRLNGIFWDSVSPSAIINNEIVFIGSSIMGIEVVDIDEKGVTLNDGTKEFRLNVEE